MASKSFSPVINLKPEDQAKIEKRKAKQTGEIVSSSGAAAVADETPAVAAPVARKGPRAKQQQVQGGGAVVGELDQQQKSRISDLQTAWDEANKKSDYAGMEAAHNEAERIRATAGYSGGTDGSEQVIIPRRQRSVLDGGYTADDVEQMMISKKKASSDGATYHNGYGPDMNNRSDSNFIRQQMKANSDAYPYANAEEKQYLHDQNVALEALLREYNGGVQSVYNEALGRWETEDGNLGYGYDTGSYKDVQWAKDVYGMTDEEIEKYRNDTSLYYNFVEQGGARNWRDESSGFTGKYAQYVNGPYSQWLGASALGRPNYTTDHDVIGDGVGGELEDMYVAPPRDEQGNFILQQPYLKGGNVNDYTRSKAAYIENGVIMPGLLDGTKSKTAHLNMWLNGGTPVDDPGEDYGVTWGTAPTAHTRMGGSVRRLSDLGLGGESDSYEALINNYYDAQLETQTAQLQAQYDQAIAELDLKQMQTDADYESQRRAADGEAARQAAAFREIANAQGLNSGAIGQSALTAGSQAISNLGVIGAAQTAATADIAAQRALMAQSYQKQIQQAQADNDYARVQALYAEAERVDELLRQQQMQNAQTDQAYMQLFMGA